jgi:hypothetical protein
MLHHTAQFIVRFVILHAAARFMLIPTAALFANASQVQFIGGQVGVLAISGVLEAFLAWFPEQCRSQG